MHPLFIEKFFFLLLNQEISLEKRLCPQIKLISANLKSRNKAKKTFQCKFSFKDEHFKIILSDKNIEIRGQNVIYNLIGLNFYIELITAYVGIPMDECGSFKPAFLVIP